MLLERGSKQKLTPMHQAAKNDSLEAFAYFLEKDPKNNTVNDRLPVSDFFYIFEYIFIYLLLSSTEKIRAI